MPKVVRVGSHTREESRQTSLMSPPNSKHTWDRLLEERGMTKVELTGKVGIPNVNLSISKDMHRLSTLSKTCIGEPIPWSDLPHTLSQRSVIRCLEAEPLETKETP
ncbi:hypothetical protein FE391_05980 [Nonomuraea sp. KC401]|uniref:hypothetical protein n=1 Tax=unclassified Nonomuraea TaxID=2593643 RepID=UPI0010FDA2CF|nr:MULTISPECIES: hypothetical protein [unclassified Nonomuraea]NBE92351.1 hypothetical protein [Nonomuraea sp. K271]TLF81847.1 hypothetical protein FE391_05980 [Nonomuraea sp. KC401]